MDMQTDRIERPARTSRASTSSKATSRSTRSGSSTTSRSATWCCRWSRSPRRRPTCSEPLRVFELDFEANLPIVRACVQLPQAPGLSVDLRGLRHVAATREFDPESSRAGARPDQQAALDLRVREAADGPRDLRLRHAGGPRLHAVPPVQLDRRRASTRSTRRRKAARASSRSSSATSCAARRSSWSTAARRSARSPTSTTASTR